VVKALEQATQRAQAADRMRQEAQAEATAAGRLRDMQAKQLAAANTMVADLHAQVTRLERDSGEAVRGLMQLLLSGRLRTCLPLSCITW
jgi:hypothetical protein